VAATAVVMTAKYRGELGNHVEVGHGQGYATVHNHMSRFAAILKEGDCIEAGTVIGFASMTGLIASPHLHFGVTGTAFGSIQSHSCRSDQCFANVLARLICCVPDSERSAS